MFKILKHSNIELSHIKTGLFMLGGFVMVMHIIVTLVYWRWPNEATDSLRYVFDLDNEFNFPSVYTGGLLAMVAYANFILVFSAKNRRNNIMYGLTALFFFYLLFDEVLILHERFAEPIRDLLTITTDSVVYHAWVIPAVLVVIGIYLASKFLLQKDRVSRFQHKIILKVVVLGLGVVVLEIIGTQLYFSDVAYKLGPVLVEEMFEIGMISWILFDYTKFLITQ